MDIEYVVTQTDKVVEAGRIVEKPMRPLMRCSVIGDRHAVAAAMQAVLAGGAEIEDKGEGAFLVRHREKRIEDGRFVDRLDPPILEGTMLVDLPVRDVMQLTLAGYASIKPALPAADVAAAPGPDAEAPAGPDAEARAEPVKNKKGKKR